MQTKPVVSRAKAYLKARQKSVRDAMKELNLDTLMLTHPPDLAYLTNFTGDDSIGLITAKDMHLVTDFRYKEQAEIEAGWVKLNVREGKMAEALAKTVLRDQGQAHRLRSQFRHRRPDRRPATGDERGLQGPQRRQAAGTRPARKRDGQHPPGEGRHGDRPDPQIGRASPKRRSRPSAARSKSGDTENYIAGQLVAELRSRGASNSSFPVIVAAGAASSLPHYRPERKASAERPAAAHRLGRALQRLLQRSDPHDDGRPRQRPHEADLPGGARSAADGDQLPPPRRHHPPGRPRRPRRHRQGRVQRHSSVTASVTASAATSTNCRR